MNVDLVHFLKLTAAMAAPLVGAGCVIVPDADDRDTDPQMTTSGVTDTAGPASGHATEAGGDATSTGASSGSSTGAADTGTDGTTTTGEDRGSSTGDGLDGSDSGTAGPGPGDCCQAAADGVTGCLDAGVQACVCAADPECCDVQWDTLCAAQVELDACGSCPEFQSVLCLCDITCGAEPSFEDGWGLCVPDAEVGAELATQLCEQEVSSICEGAAEASCDGCVCAPNVESGGYC